MEKRHKTFHEKYFQNLLGSVVTCLLVTLIPFFKYYQAYPYIFGFCGLLLLVLGCFWIAQHKWESFHIRASHILFLIALGLVAATLNEVLLNSVGGGNLIWFALISVYGVLYIGPSYLWKWLPCLVISFICLKLYVNSLGVVHFEPHAVHTVFVANYISSIFALLYACYFLIGRESQIHAELTLKEVVKGDESRMAIISVVNQNIVRKFLDPLKVIIQANSALMKLAPLETSNLEKISVGITNSSARILNITKSLLKVSGDEKNSDFEFVSLPEIIDDAASSFKQSRNIRYLNTKVEGALGQFFVFANRHEFREVLFVLLQNSFESTQKVDSRKIDVTLFRQGKTAVISVIDSGVGISNDVKDQIFNPFFSTKEIGGGTGLGLSVAAGVVESLGGTIRLASGKPGKCIFLIQLPLADKDRL
ncbi:MAG: HAMP domain-containing sensor histidine kinase [Pseudomonadota bacterium]